MTREKNLTSNLELETPPQQKISESVEKPRTEEREVDLKHLEEQREEEVDKDTGDLNENAGLFDEQFDRGQEAEGSGGGYGAKTDVAECSNMLIDSSGAGVDDDAVVEEPKAGEVNDVMDSAEMCYDSVVLPTLPPEGSREVQEAPLEYTETYMSSLAEREGVLISTVPAPSSPSTFFQATNMDVAGSNAVAPSWGELHSTHDESGYGTAPSSSDASPGGGNSTEEREFVDSLCEEPSKVDGPDLVKEPSLSGPEQQITTTKDIRFETIESSGISDTENEYLSPLTTEDTHHQEGRRSPSGALPRKDKAPLGQLSLRSVLSDPITGAFMNDAMVAMCGHSFGSGSLHRVLETHVCERCGATVPPTTLVPNFALRAAVLAYKHEDQLWQMRFMKGTKRRREQFELPEGSELKVTSKDQAGSAENNYSDSSRSKGVQFPFAVSDRVVIKGNKRTPERFVGMEALIASQCLNGCNLVALLKRFVTLGADQLCQIVTQMIFGLYLVRTLDTGESVRLQYRSLQKLGETNASEAQQSAEHSDVYGSPKGIESLTQYPSGIKSASDSGLETGALMSKEDTAIASSACPSMAQKDLTAYFSERETNAPLRQSVGAIEDGQSSPLSGGIPVTPRDLIADQGQRNLHNASLVEDLSKPLDSLDVNDVNTSENLKVAGEEANFDAVVHKSGVDEMSTMSAIQFESGDGQLLRTGLHHDTGAEVWIGTEMCDVGAPALHTGQESQIVLPSGQGEDDVAVGELPTAGYKLQENGTESLRTRSKRTTLYNKTSVSSDSFLTDSDPYRKVYSSGSRRRNGKPDCAVKTSPDLLPADSKSLIKGSNPAEKVSEKMLVKGSTIGTSGGGKQGREMKVKSANELLQIMRQDMLKLEKQVPGNYMSRTWRVHRINWRKLVKASQTVSDLGAQVRDLRYSLLLTTAGDMSDEEWEMRIALIIESGDVELLVSLWGRLYTDVYKWLESRPTAVKLKDILCGSASGNHLQDACKPDADISEDSCISSVHKMTAATLAAVDAVAGGQQDPDTSIKALLASTKELLHQQSCIELAAVREALEREKRHITAKLAQLEGSFADLRWSLEPNRIQDGPTSVRTSPIGDLDLTSTALDSQGISGVTPFESIQGYETEECNSDSALPGRDADGEATDMSDSD